MFGTVKNKFTQYANSFLGQSPDMKGDERIPVDELLTLEQLQELLEDWIATVWQNRPHGALRDPRHPRLKLSPNQMVNAYRELVPEIPIPLDADRYLALLPTQWRTILPYGINLQRRLYDSEGLDPLRNVRSPYGHHDGKWPVHFDPYNPMTAWVETPSTFIPVSWRSANNGAPMIDEIWRVARAQAAAQGDDAPGRADFERALQRFMGSGNQPMTSRERKRDQANGADLLGVTNQLRALEATPDPGDRSTPAPLKNQSASVSEQSASVSEGEPGRAGWPVAPPFGTTRNDALERRQRRKET